MIIKTILKFRSQYFRCDGMILLIWTSLHFLEVYGRKWRGASTSSQSRRRPLVSLAATLDLPFCEIHAVGVGCRRGLHYVPRPASFNHAPPPLFSLCSFVPLSDPSCIVSDNGERSLFPENDYADWKVREDLAVYLEMKGEMRLRKARLHSS